MFKKLPPGKKKKLQKKVPNNGPKILKFNFNPDIHSALLNQIHEHIQLKINQNQLQHIQLNTFLNYKILKQQKSVCAKVIKGNDTVVQCLNCRVDSSCIICLQCFENGNHEGHKYKIKKNAGGCCDCGDREAWKKQGFCKKHTGQNKPIQIQVQKQKQFDQIWKHLLYWYLVSVDKQFKQDFGKYIIKFLKLFSTSSMYYNTLTTNLFSSKFDKDLFEFDQQKIYTQNILENIFEYSTNQIVNKIFSDSFIGMFSNYQFKKLILKTFFVKYQSVLIQGDKNFGNLSCQLLTSYQLVSEFLKTNPMLLTHKFKLNFLDNQHTLFYRYSIDLKYILKLQGDAPLLYCKMLLQNFDNFNCINSYQEQIEKNWKSSYEDTFYLDKFYLELELIEITFLIGRIIKNEKQLVVDTILRLIQYLSRKQIKNECFFFLHRFLSVLIFIFIESKVQILYQIQKSQSLIKILGKLQQNKQIFQPFFKCCSFYLNLKTNQKKRELFRTFYYFYSQVYRQAFNIDIFMMTIYNNFQSSKSQSILHKFFKYNDPKLQMIILQLNNQNLKQQQQQGLIQSINNQIDSIAFLLQISISRSQIISFAYSIDEHNLYREQIKYLLNLVLSTYNNVTVEILDEFKKMFFNKKMNIESELKEISKYDKNAKKYVVNNKLESQLIMHYLPTKKSFCNITNEHDIKIKTLEIKFYLHQSAKNIFSNIFRERIIQDLLKFIQKIYVYLNKYSSTKVKQALDNLFVELIKISIIAKKVNNDQISNMLDSIFQNEQYRNKMNKETLSLLPQKLKKKNSTPVEIQNQAGQKLKETNKKISVKQLQRRKIQQIKQKQKKFTESLGNQIQQESPKTQQQFCVVCKSQQQNKIYVYLAHASFSNLSKYAQIEALQRLAKKSEGKLLDFIHMMIDYKNNSSNTNLIITSCHHLIHYQCYVSYIKSSKGGSSCPLCKKSSNIFVPIIDSIQKLQVQLTKNQLQIVVNFLNILEKLQQFHQNKTQIVMQQQSDKNKRYYCIIIKSFMEVLVFNGIVNTQFFIKKLLKTYKTILMLLKQFFKIVPLQKIQQQKQNVLQQILYKNFFKEEESYDQQLNNYLTEYVKNSFQYQIYTRLTEYIEGKQMQQQKMDNLYYTKNYSSNQELNSIFLKRFALLEYLFNHNQTNLQNFDTLIQKNKLVQAIPIQKFFNFVLDIKPFQLVQLPTRYAPLSKSRGKCPNCKILGNNICICLICNWKGCKGCQQESLFQHSLLWHATNTIFLNIETTQLIFSGPSSFWQGEPIYINDIGEKFKIFKQWQDFEIDYNEILKAEKLINEYEMSSYILYQELKFGKRFLFDRF